jgi:predicted oxidoreductase
MSMSDLAIDAPEVFEFLDNLRESGKTNMFGAAPYVQEVFDLNKFEARYLVSEWMRTFSERHPA